MLMFILKWICYALSVMFVAWILPGIDVTGFWGAMLVAIVLGLINTFIKPLLMFISIPLNILTLGLFTLIINALLMMLAGYITPGFIVDGFWSALIGALILSVITTVINSIMDKQNEDI